MTVSRSLTRSLLIGAYIYALIAAFVIPYALLAPSPVRTSDPAEPSPAELQAAAHGCWHRTAPADMAGRMPGAMVTTDGRYITDAALVEAELVKVLSGQPATAFAFCRGDVR